MTEANTGDISVKLKRNRKRSGDEVIADVRAKIKKAEPVLDVEFPQLLQDMIGDLTSAPEPVVIKLFCAGSGAAERSGPPQVADTIKKIPGVVDVLNGIENTISGPATVFNVDPVATARAGFTPQEVELDASAILQGEPAPPPVVVNDRSYTIRVRFPERTRATHGRHPQHAAGQRHGQDGHHRLAGQHASRFPARPKSAARTCSATCR